MAEIVLNPQVAFRITEEGEKLVLNFIIKAGKNRFEIKSGRFELNKNIPEANQKLFLFKSSTENIKNILDPFQTRHLVVQIGQDIGTNAIKQHIDQFKYEVYSYAKSIELSTDVQGKLEDTEVRRNFGLIKDSFIERIYQSMVLLPGNYIMDLDIDYKEHGFIPRHDDFTKTVRFKMLTNPDAQRVSLHNFLGEIMSSILFSPDKPVVLSYPEIKGLV